jgi:FHA domain
MEANLTSPLGRTDLTSNVLTIGRAPDNLLVLQDQQASSHHAEIRPDGQGYLLVDVNSRNGTFVNEQPLAPQTPRLLISGDVIRIGETRLTYQIAGSDEATVRANAAEYGNPGYAPTVAVPPPSQPDYMNYQQPSPAAPDFQQPPPAYPGYQQPAPFAQNFPQANQPGYAPQPQAYPTPAYPQQPQGYPQQAPWAGAPGQFGAPSAPAAAQPKKRRTGLIIGIIVLLLLVVGGVGAFVFVNRSTPDKTLAAFCTALKNNDAQGAYNQFGTNITSGETEQQYAPKFAAFENALNTPAAGGLKDCVVSNVQENGSAATGTITLSVNRSTNTLPINYTLSNENGTWKIENGNLPTQTGQ